MIPSNYSAVAKITAFLITFAALAPSVLAKGLAALREQSHHSKDRAKLFFFEDVRVLPYQIRFEIKGRAAFVTKNSPLCEWVESLPRFSKNLLEEKDIAPYRKSLKECEDFLVNYPHAKKHLDPYTQILKDEIGKFDSGLIKHNDNWISKDQYETKQKEAEEKAALKAKLAQEERAKREAQRLAKKEEDLRIQKEKKEKEKIDRLAALQDFFRGSGKNKKPARTLENVRKLLKEYSQMPEAGNGESGGASFTFGNEINMERMLSLLGNPSNSYTASMRWAIRGAAQVDYPVIICEYPDFWDSGLPLRLVFESGVLPDSDDKKDWNLFGLCEGKGDPEGWAFDIEGIVMLFEK